MQVLQITCQGSPYEIGKSHGSQAAQQVLGSIAFYTDLFESSAKLQWPEVLKLTKAFETSIRTRWPAYHEEMQGIADGAGVQLADIIALNVRTEITFGLFSDGCTSVSWKTQNASLLGQNWDWHERQKKNIIVTTIVQDGFPEIQMMTEAGIIGKIGLNSAGVGVCLNAIRARGVDESKMPVHLALRKTLESQSAIAAAAALNEAGVAASAHLLMADANGSIGFECSSTTTKELAPDPAGRVFHSNHLIAEHEGVDEPPWLDDSRPRLRRAQDIANSMKPEPGLQEFFKIFKDQMGSPTAICREAGHGDDLATLFNIVMDLKAKKAIVTMGKPCSPESTIALQFDRN